MWHTCSCLLLEYLSLIIPKSVTSLECRFHKYKQIWQCNAQALAIHHFWHSFRNVTAESISVVFQFCTCLQFILLFSSVVHCPSVQGIQKTNGIWFWLVDEDHSCPYGHFLYTDRHLGRTLTLCKAVAYLPRLKIPAPSGRMKPTVVRRQWLEVRDVNHQDTETSSP